MNNTLIQTFQADNTLVNTLDVDTSLFGDETELKVRGMSCRASVRCGEVNYPVFWMIIEVLIFFLPSTTQVLSNM